MGFLLRYIDMNNITPLEAQKLIQDGSVTVLDVRTPAEFTGGHIAGATNIDIYEDSFPEKVRALDPNLTYVVNCQSGGRSARACSVMQELGITDIMNLEGGIGAWKNAGLPVV